MSTTDLCGDRFSLAGYAGIGEWNLPIILDRQIALQRYDMGDELVIHNQHIYLCYYSPIIALNIPGPHRHRVPLLQGKHLPTEMKIISD